MDRAHRLGQKRVVNVYRLITRGTLEESIMGLQNFKKNLVRLSRLVPVGPSARASCLWSARSRLLSAPPPSEKPSVCTHVCPPRCYLESILKPRLLTFEPALRVNVSRERGNHARLLIPSSDSTWFPA